MANISLTIKSDFAQAERDFRALMGTSEAARAKIESFQKSFKTEQIDKFLAKNRLIATGIRATQGPLAAVTAETAGLQKKIQSLIAAGLDPEDAAIRRLRNEYIQLSKKKSELTRATNTNSSAFMSHAVTIAAVYAAIRAASAAWNAFIAPAMQAQEAASKFATIFGGQAEQVTAWADNMGTAMARSSRELQSMAADAMALISPMSGSRDAAISMSQGLVQMAQDLASFHNVDVTEAFTALRSGISGETEPMKRFGIMLTDAALAEYALSQGITKRIRDMTTAEKTQLRYNAMMNSMGAAQGDAARTSGSLTNQLRALEGRINDVSVAIGDRSVEGMTQLARGMAMVADESSVLVRGAQEASGAVGGLSDLFGREMQAEAYGRRLLETYDAMDQLNGVVIATTAHMGEALGTAGLGGIVNVMGMLKTDFGRLRVEYAVTSTQITSMSLGLAGRYGSLAKALEDSSDRQVQQFVRLRENLERLSDTARRTLGWDLSRGWFANIASGAGTVNSVLDSINRAQQQYNQSTASSGVSRAERARRDLEQRVSFENQWLERVREGLVAEAETREEAAALRVEQWKSEYGQALEEARKHQADRTNIDAYYTRQRIRIEQEEQKKKFDLYVRGAQQTISATGELFANIQTIMTNFGKENKALAIALKVTACAEAAINSYLAFTKCLAELPYPFSFIAAGITLAAGLAKQAAIASTPISAETGITNYTVPEIRTNRNDNAPVMASAGEQVTVTPRGESAESTTSVNIQIGEDTLFRVVQRGINTGKININQRNLGRSVFA